MGLLLQPSYPSWEGLISFWILDFATETHAESGGACVADSGSRTPLFSDGLC